MRVTPLNRWIYVLWILLVCSIALIWTFMFLTVENFSLSPTFFLTILPVTTVVIFIILLPFIISKPREVMVDGQKGHEYLLYAFGDRSYLLRWKGTIRIYSTETSIYIGIWPKKQYHYTDIQFFRRVPSVLTHRYKLTLQPNKNFYLDFGRSTQAEAFIQTLRNHDVKVDI